MKKASWYVCGDILEGLKHEKKVCGSSKSRTVNPQSLKALRIDNEGMTDDIKIHMTSFVTTKL